MSPSVTLVPPTAAEIPQLLSLVEDFYALEGMVFSAAVAQSYGTLLEHPDWGQLFWLRCEGAIAGYAALTFFFSFEYHGRSAILDELYLCPQCRGRGLGSAALAQVEAFCRQEGIPCLNLVVDGQNIAAQRLYAKHGFATLRRQLCIKWLI